MQLKKEIDFTGRISLNLPAVANLPGRNSAAPKGGVNHANAYTR